MSEIKLTPDETRYLLQQKDVRERLASFNRIKAARHQTEIGDSVELLNRAREFRAMGSERLS